MESDHFVLILKLFKAIRTEERAVKFMTFYIEHNKDVQTQNMTEYQPLLIHFCLFELFVLNAVIILGLVSKTKQNLDSHRIDFKEKKKQEFRFICSSDSLHLMGLHFVKRNST